MKKRAILILITFILGSAGMLSPVCHALAAAQDVKTESEAGKGAEKESEKDNKGIGETIYEKVDEAIKNLDQTSLRRNIRQGLKEMDDMGIAPSVIAERTLGIKTQPTLRGQTSGNTSGTGSDNTLVKEAENAVRKKTESFFTILWNGFLDGLSGLVTFVFSLAASGEGAGK